LSKPSANDRTHAVTIALKRGIIDLSRSPQLDSYAAAAAQNDGTSHPGLTALF